jgi:hypothetical protein
MVETPGLAVIAHAGARQTIVDFFPLWQGLGVPIYGFMPRGESWPAECEPKATFNYGKSAHKGPEAFERIIHVLTVMGLTEHDQIVLIEPDCVPLRNELPELFPGAICGWPCNVAEGEWPRAFLPPWTMARETARLFVEKCSESAREHHPDCLDLTDRWIDKAAAGSGIPTRLSRNVLGYSWHCPIKRVLEALRPAWVHGWKSRAEMEAAWPI